MTRIQLIEFNLYRRELHQQLKSLVYIVSRVQWSDDDADIA